MGCFVKCQCFIDLLSCHSSQHVGQTSQLKPSIGNFSASIKICSLIKHYILFDLWPYRWFSAPASGVLHISESKEWERLKPHIHHESRSWILLLQQRSYQPQGNQRREHLAWQGSFTVSNTQIQLFGSAAFWVLHPLTTVLPSGRRT